MNLITGCEMQGNLGKLARAGQKITLYLTNGDKVNAIAKALWEEDFEFIVDDRSELVKNHDYFDDGYPAYVNLDSILGYELR